MSDLIEPVVLELLLDIEPVLQQFEIDFYVVGAIARDIQLGGFVNTRKTKDVDIAIRVGDEAQFSGLKQALIETGNFEAHPSEAIKLFYKTALEIDLLPFGDIEDDQREIRLQDPTLFIINMPGFKELYPFVTDVKLSSGQNLKICSLEGLVMLKIIAYGDRPSRTKDIADIDHIIRYYFELSQDNIYENHFDVMNLYPTKETIYLELVGARVIGRKIRIILSNDEKLTTRILATLSKRPTNIWQALSEGIKDN